MREKLAQVIESAVKDLFDVDVAVELTRPEEQFGDYATNVALQLASRLGKTPREIAEALAEKLSAQGPSLRRVEVAGAGFLNLTLSDQTLLALAAQGPSLRTYDGQAVVIETNNPNPFKDLHIGHAMNSIAADTIANLLEAGGATVHRVSYHGDVGLHVGKSMWAILRFVSSDASKLDEVPEGRRPKFLSEKYAEGASAYEADPAAKQAIDELTKQSFAQTNGLFKEVYASCKQWSFDYFAHVFQQLGSQPVEKQYLESEADDAGRRAVEQKLGAVFEPSEGAVIFPGERCGLHTVVFISSGNTTLYAARDLGLMQLKQRDYAPSKSYIVTAIEQKEYFRVVIKAAELALPELAGVTHNIPTGLVKLATGKMSSRKGTAINIAWLFDELTKALQARGASEQTLRDGLIGALRYTMLKNRLGNDIIFDINEAISLEGNSGPYLQYAHARACSILSKATNFGSAVNKPAATNSRHSQLDWESSKKSIAAGDSISGLDSRLRGNDVRVVSSEIGNDVQLEVGERTLTWKISEYPEVLERAVAELLPHHICTYLYELAQTFNRFYEHNRVLGDEREELRLQLVRLYASTLKNGLECLGIPAPERL